MSDYDMLLLRVEHQDNEISWLKSSLVTLMTFCNSERPPSYAALAEVARRGLEGSTRPRD